MECSIYRRCASSAFGTGYSHRGYTGSMYLFQVCTRVHTNRHQPSAVLNSIPIQPSLRLVDNNLEI